MSDCGGTIGTQRIIVGSDPIQLVGKMESRTRLTIRAEPNNTAYIFLTSHRGMGFREGFPLGPGEAYQFDDRGARAEVYALTSGTDNLTAYVITEGA